MPAITLGLAEVEERLQALRWRLNLRTAQHGIYVTLATALVLGSALIPVGLHGSPATFRMVAWTSALMWLLVALACAAHAWRCWSNVRGVARLVDERAQLTDRLTTLVDLRLRQRTARLAPVLVAQTLALGDRWRPQRIVPHPVPRSVFLLLAALLTLAGTTAVERYTRRRAGRASTAHPQAATPDTYRAASQLASGQLARTSANGDPTGAQARVGQSRTGAIPESGSEASFAPASRTDTAGPSGPLDAGNASITDRLQQAITSTFRADTLEAAPQRRGQSGDIATPAAGIQADDQHHSGGDIENGRRAPDHARGATRGQARTAPASNGSAPHRPGGSQAPRKFAGDSPDAGEGSSPGALMQGAGTQAGGDAPASQPFPLTITSVPHAREAHGAPAKRARTGAAVPSLAAPGADNAPALSDRQLADAALRKATIPPEYEDAIRSIFTDRAGR